MLQYVDLTMQFQLLQAGVVNAKASTYRDDEFMRSGLHFDFNVS